MSAPTRTIKKRLFRMGINSPFCQVEGLVVCRFCF
jgi:hypothetical protein